MMKTPRTANAKTGQAAKSPVIDVLNKARAAELAAISQYMAQHYALDDQDYGQVAANLKLIAIDEMRHAEMFAERIFELEGLPVTRSEEKAKTGQEIGAVMAHDAGLEVTAVKDYNAFMEVCLKNRDNLSAKLFEQITQEEQIHLNYFKNVGEHIAKLGTAYLAQITGGPAETGPGARGFVAAQGAAGAGA